MTRVFSQLFFISFLSLIFLNNFIYGHPKTERAVEDNTPEVENIDQQPVPELPKEEQEEEVVNKTKETESPSEADSAGNTTTEGDSETEGETKSEEEESTTLSDKNDSFKDIKKNLRINMEQSQEQLNELTQKQNANNPFMQSFVEPFNSFQPMIDKFQTPFQELMQPMNAMTDLMGTLG